MYVADFISIMVSVRNLNYWSFLFHNYYFSRKFLYNIIILFPAYLIQPFGFLFWHYFHTSLPNCNEDSMFHLIEPMSFSNCPNSLYTLFCRSQQMYNSFKSFHNLFSTKTTYPISIKKMKFDLDSTLIKRIYNVKPTDDLVQFPKTESHFFSVSLFNPPCYV